MAKKRKKQISRIKYPHLNRMKQSFENKNLDELASVMWNLYTANGLRLDEVAALNFYLMKNALEQKGNAKFLEEKFGLKINELNSEGILQIQQALLGAYHENYKQG